MFTIVLPPTPLCDLHKRFIVGVPQFLLRSLRHKDPVLPSKPHAPSACRTAIAISICLDGRYAQTRMILDADVEPQRSPIRSAHGDENWRFLVHALKIRVFVDSYGTGINPQWRHLLRSKYRKCSIADFAFGTPCIIFVRQIINL